MEPWLIVVVIVAIIALFLFMWAVGIYNNLAFESAGRGVA